MADEFGGIAVDEPSTDEFGGVAISEPVQSPQAPEPSVNPQRYVAGGGPMAGMAMLPEAPDIPRIEGKSTLGKIGAAAVNLPASLYNAAKSPLGITAAVAAPASPIIGTAMGIGFGLPAIYQGLKEVYKYGAGVGDLQSALEGAGQTGIGAAMAVPALASASRLLPRIKMPESVRPPIEIPPAKPLTGEAREFQILRENWLPTIKPWRRQFLDEQVAKGQGVGDIETNFEDSPGARDVVRAKRYYELARKLFGRTEQEVPPTEPTPKLPAEEKGAPADEAGVPPPTAPATVEAKAGEVAPSPAGPAITEPKPVEPVGQATSVTPPVTEQPRITISDLTKYKTKGGYSPLTGQVFLDKESVSKMTPEERASVVRHELAHKIETEEELWDKTDTYLWNLWKQDRNHPIWDFSGEVTGRVGMRNDVSPEVIAQLYAEHYPKRTFTVRERPVPYEYEGEDIQLPKEYPIPQPLMEVLDKIESKLGIWKKKLSRQGKTLPTTEGSVGPGMGGALAKGEIPETGAGGEKYGVAERVRAERAQAGQVDVVEPGAGTGAEAQVQKYREVVRADPTAGPRLLEAFEADPKKQISAELEGVTRAHGEALFAGARTIEERYGTDSPQYRDAYKVASDWDRRTKPIQTQWSEIGRGQQGETDIDTGSFTGLRRERQRVTDKDFTPAQKPKAEKIAADNKQAQTEVDKASENLNKRIRQKAVPSAEQAAIDAANKTVREADVAMAEAVNKQRVTEQELKTATEQVTKDAQQKAIDAANRTVASDAIRKAREENLARVKKAALEKKYADAEVAAAQRKKAAADKLVRDNAIKAAKEARLRQADPSIAVWELAKKYLEQNKGLYGFDDIRNKISVDLGMKPDQVTYWLSRDATTKRLADDLWNKQRNARRLKEQAKNWLRELDTPGYQKALASLPRLMFSLSVGGHGFVALGTHAPIVAFQPRFWNAYVRNFGKMYKQVFSPAYYESQMQDLVRRPNYEVARRNGLQNDPFKYEEFHTGELSRLIKGWLGEKNMDRVDKFLSAGNRGYGVLKLIRQDMFDQQWNKYPDSIKKQEGVARAIAKGVNHATGVTEAAAPKGSNILLFAPRLAGSRVMWLGGDPIRAVNTIANWKNASTADKVFSINQMKEKAWVFGTFASLLAANQGFLMAAGSKQKINGIPESLGGAGFDPLASDFMKFKALGGNIAYGGALLTLAKLPARVAVSILYEGKGSKYILEDERVDKVIGSYVRSQMSPFAGTLSDLALGRDYEERPLPAKMFGMAEQPGAVPKRLQAIGVDEPYTWGEYAATKAPIPIAEAIKEGLRASGMSDSQVQAWGKALAVGSLMTFTGTRITEDTREE